MSENRVVPLRQPDAPSHRRPPRQSPGQL